MRAEELKKIKEELKHTWLYYYWNSTKFSKGCAVEAEIIARMFGISEDELEQIRISARDKYEEEYREIEESEENER